MTDLPGYVCYRRDRAGRVGGGVVIYVQDCVDFAVYCPPGDNQLFELFWIKFKVDAIDFYLGGLYHPSKPIYPVNDFVHFFQSFC